MFKTKHIFQIEEDELSSGNFDVENVSQKAGGGDGGPSSSYHLAISGPTLTVICSEYPEMLEHLVGAFLTFRID